MRFINLHSVVSMDTGSCESTPCYAISSTTNLQNITCTTGKGGAGLGIHMGVMSYAAAWPVAAKIILLFCLVVIGWNIDKLAAALKRDGLRGGAIMLVLMIALGVLFAWAFLAV